MLWVCSACTASYSVDAPKCPNCGATEHRTSEDPTPEPAPAGGKKKSDG